MRIKEKSKKQKTETSPPESADRKKGGIKALWIAFLSATGGALMESYTSFLSQNIGPLCLSFIAWAQDHVMPMPADQQIVAQLTFYMPAKLTTDHSAEIMGVSLLGRDCDGLVAKATSGPTSLGTVKPTQMPLSGHHVVHQAKPESQSHREMAALSFFTMVFSTTGIKLNLAQYLVATSTEC
ncbi:hypothetical protein C6380_09055 [Pseudomonas syringae pv. actinidiae]|uniref:hypothetical protein n=1 Tax=Pseudomonas syringae TaxID=317 RepID=UPI000BB560E5|nr:hypothetical protein [Pseudomonas syringae]PBK51643.1 hypothetical protein BUE61_16645 [Pseudomonas syringae pv. actinidiae]PBK55344.1 hypothetical protein BUE60_06915 [Pseudomonas syringae pv. actinidiae]RJX58249.1 hypothetical protein C6380_09055 [Pseudomonas syringae pv. actinidiae]RJX60624.1 hypothetical protein C6379_06000 [Pseudomonas syringae pv. actinidiae]RJX63413.1 hypothetical protein C6383_06595 [Pseudomonas syringae pv. actinidiae]